MKREPRDVTNDGPPFRIARDGTWFHGPSPITKRELVKLFSTILKRETDGSYWLWNPGEKCRVAVDDVPYLAVAASVQNENGNACIDFTTNLDEVVRLSPEHPLRLAEQNGAFVPYVLVRAGCEARVDRNLYYHLQALAEPHPERPDELGIWSCGTFYMLGRITHE